MNQPIRNIPLLPNNHDLKWIFGALLSNKNFDVGSDTVRSFLKKLPKVGYDVGTETTFITLTTNDGRTIRVSQDEVDKHNQACDQLPILVAREQSLERSGAVDTSSVNEEIRFHLRNLRAEYQELAPHLFKALPM